MTPLGQTLLRSRPITRLEVEGRCAVILSNASEVVLKRVFAEDAPIENHELVGVGLEDAFLSLSGHADATGRGAKAAHA